MPVGYFTVVRHGSRSEEFRFKALPKETVRNFLFKKSEKLHLKEVKLSSDENAELCFWKNKKYYPAIPMEVLVQHCSAANENEVALTSAIGITDEAFFEEALHNKIKKKMKFDEDQGYFYFPR